MTKVELERKLKEMNIKETMYCLNGGTPNDTYCLEKCNEKWCVYYSERGKRTFLKEFNSEEKACNYLLSWIMRIVLR